MKRTLRRSKRRSISRAKYFKDTERYKNRKADLFRALDLIKNDLRNAEGAMKDAAIRFTQTMDSYHAIEHALIKLEGSKHYVVTCR